ncbi:hypothetical protein, partial [Senegalimassilia anaerobia]|uniref:hypothetical protein n=1 Tax=Senegalimassilia anaerobia TaxID=1473216 RepID=UPI0026EAAA23
GLLDSLLLPFRKRGPLQKWEAVHSRAPFYIVGFRLRGDCGLMRQTWLIGQNSVSDFEASAQADASFSFA